MNEQRIDEPAVRAERPWVWWGIAYLAAAVILCLTTHQSGTGDSRYYNAQVMRLAERPPSQWLVPTWGKNKYGRVPEHAFRDHPTSFFVPAIVLARLGVPAMHALHLINMLCTIVSLVLLARMASGFVPAAMALAVLWGLQLTPIFTNHMIRANHEQGMLLMSVLALYGGLRMAKDFRWAGLVAAAAAGMFLVKGMVVFIVPALAFVALVGSAPRDRWLRGAGVLALASLAAPVAMGLYELAYRAASGGESFFAEYWQLQIQSRSVEGAGAEWSGRWGSFVYYVGRHLGYMLPWTVLALLFAWRPRWSAGERRLVWTFAGASLAFILLFSMSPRHASRYVYPSFFLFGVPLVVLVVSRYKPLTRFQGVVAAFGAHRFAAALWFTIFGVHLAKALWR